MPSQGNERTHGPSIVSVPRPRHEEIRAAILSPPVYGLTVHDVTGAWGTGKTQLLSSLVSVLSTRAAVVVCLTFADYFVSESSSQAYDVFQQCCAVANDVAEQLPNAKAGRDLRGQINAIWKPLQWSRGHHPGVQLRADRNATIQGVQIEINSAGMLDGALQDSQRRVGEHVGTTLRTIADQRSSFVAFLVDDFHHVAGNPVGAWLLELLRQTRHALVVVTRLPSHGRPSLPGTVQRYELPVLGCDEIAAYLGQRLGAAPSDDLSKRVYAATAGLPPMVSFVAEVLGDADESVDVFRRLPDGGSRLNPVKLVDDLLNVHSDRRLAAALHRLAVSRRFDADLLATLLDGLVPAEDIGPLRGELGQMGLVRESIDEETNERYYFVPELLRADLEDRLAKTDPKLHQELHTRAEEHYRGRLVSHDEQWGDDDPMESWGRYEDVAWQRDHTEWLHHLAHMIGRDLGSTRLGLAQLYFEGFYWYEENVPHRFCPELLADWQRLCRTRRDQEWLNQLTTFHVQYPRGWRKAQAPADAWHAVRDALRFIRRDAGLERPRPRLDETAAQVRALTSYLLANAVRWGEERDTRKAEQLYQDAREWFRGDRNTWCRMWCDWDLAELALEQGDTSLARRDVPKLERAAREEHDVERLAHVCRLYADALWVDGNLTQAMGAYLRAVLFALEYNVYADNIQRVPPDLDPYTKHLYLEMTERTTERLAELRSRGLEELADKTVSASRRLFMPYWEHAGVSPRQGQLFAPPPDDNDLYQPNPPYQQHVDAMVDHWREILDQPIIEPFPLLSE